MSSPRSDLLASMSGLIAEKIAAQLPGLRTAEGFSGRLDLEVIKQRGIAAPAVLVSWYGAKIDRTSAGPHNFYRIDMTAFVITKDALGLDRHAAAATIVQALLELLPDHRWGEAGLGNMSDIAAHSLNTPDIQRAGVALWAVTWRQEVAFTAVPEAIDVPLRLYVGMAPEIGRAHEDDYELIGGGE